MSARKAKTPEGAYQLSIALERRFEKNTRFSTHPLNFSVLPWFLHDQQAILTGGIESITEKTPPVRLKLGTFYRHGKHSDQKVHGKGLQDFHKAALEVVRLSGGEILDESLVGENYHPRVKTQGHYGTPDSKFYIIDKVVLIKNLGGGLKIAEFIFELNGRPDDQPT